MNGHASSLTPKPTATADRDTRTATATANRDAVAIYGTGTSKSLVPPMRPYHPSDSNVAQSSVSGQTSTPNGNATEKLNPIVVLKTSTGRALRMSRTEAQGHIRKQEMKLGFTTLRIIEADPWVRADNDEAYAGKKSQRGVKAVYAAYAATEDQQVGPRPKWESFSAVPFSRGGDNRHLDEMFAVLEHPSAPDEYAIGNARVVARVNRKEEQVGTKWVVTRTQVLDLQVGGKTVRSGMKPNAFFEDLISLPTVGPQKLVDVTPGAVDACMQLAEAYAPGTRFMAVLVTGRKLKGYKQPRFTDTLLLVDLERAKISSGGFAITTDVQDAMRALRGDRDSEKHQKEQIKASLRLEAQGRFGEIRNMEDAIKIAIEAAYGKSLSRASCIVYGDLSLEATWHNVDPIWGLMAKLNFETIWNTDDNAEHDNWEPQDLLHWRPELQS
jgi:hypothetical protein